MSDERYALGPMRMTAARRALIDEKLAEAADRFASGDIGEPDAPELLDERLAKLRAPGRPLNP